MENILVKKKRKLYNMLIARGLGVFYPNCTGPRNVSDVRVFRMVGSLCRFYPAEYSQLEDQT